MEHTHTEQRYHSHEWGGGYIPATDEYVFSDGTKLRHSFYTDHWAARKATGRANSIHVDGYRDISTEGLEHTIIGDDPEMDKRWKAHNREVVKAMREVLDHVVNHPEFAELPEGLQHVLEQRLPFDRYAGCSCPCSPGFKVRGADNTRHMGMKGTMYIDVPEGILG